MSVCGWGGGEGVLTLLGRPPRQRRRQGLASQLTSPSLGDSERRLTFGDGVLLVHRPQELQWKDRELLSPATGLTTRQAAQPWPRDRTAAPPGIRAKPSSG